MKRMPILFSALVSIALLSGCIAGSQARSKVLNPALQNVTPRIVAGAKLAPNADAVLLDSFQAAVMAQDWVKANTLWPQVKVQAQAAIDAQVAAGTIGPTVAESFTERIKQYEADLHRMGGLSP